VGIENLKKYGRMCEENEEIRKKAKKIGLQDIDGQIAYAKTLGLEFSKEDCEALAKEAGLAKRDELSEEDLQKVAGGVITTTLALAALGGAVVVGAGSAALLSKPGW
jgi:predicted ribosomally synthesized peptide with nif11-like leader